MFIVIILSSRKNICHGKIYFEKMIKKHDKTQQY